MHQFKSISQKLWQELKHFITNERIILNEELSFDHLTYVKRIESKIEKNTIENEEHFPHHTEKKD